ncbi:MAG: nucleotide exchange factor GrpE [Candidatus Woesearchaeota archaeon]
MSAKSNKTDASFKREQNEPPATALNKTEASDDALKKVTRELENKKKEAEDYLNTLKRLQAEFENFVKRAEKERSEIANHASERLVVKLLPVIDEFENSLKEIRKTVNNDIAKGIEMIYKNFQKVLQDEGVQPIESIGKKPDPFLHEVVLTEQNNSVEDGTIIAELQKGYKMRDKVVRYAKVKIARR